MSVHVLGRLYGVVTFDLTLVLHFIVIRIRVQCSMFNVRCRVTLRVNFALPTRTYMCGHMYTNTSHPHGHFSPFTLLAYLARSKFVAARPTKPGFRWQRPASGKKRVVVST